MTLLRLQVTPCELAVRLCPASFLTLLFHGVRLSPPLNAGGWRSGATPEGVGVQRAPKGCMGRNQGWAGHWDPHPPAGQTEADSSLVPLEPFLMLQHLQRLLVGLQPFNHFPCHLPCPLSHLHHLHTGLGWRRRMGLPPSVALWLPRSQPHPAQEQSAKHPHASVPGTSVRACGLPARVQVLPFQS